MAERDLDIVVRAKGALEAARNIGKVDTAVRGITARGVAAGVAMERFAEFGLRKVIGFAEGGIASLDALENATTSVDGAIAQMGLTGQVTSGQIHGWASEIEKNVNAAFDDKAITQASTTLIRFGHVVPSNLQEAMVVMTDLATKTGDVDSAATLLSKALADPAKAAGKLARAGVVLTKAEQDQIKALMKAGKTAQAQKVILDALAKSTAGAAAASQGPYKRAISILRDVTEDAQRALAEGLLPVLEKTASMLAGELSKPQTLQNIRDFGKGLASGLASLIDIAKGLPWGAIGDALKIGGAGAKAVLDAFVAMPPWVQTAIATGWGLNKLTGGAVSSIIGALGSGLIKGVLGMNAGVVNINAGVVNGAGGIPGAGGGGGVLGAAAKVLIPVAVVAVASQAALALAQAVNPAGSKPSDISAGLAAGTLGFNGKLFVTGQKTGNSILGNIAYREQRLGEITGGKSDIIAAKTTMAYNAIERSRLGIVTAINATTSAVLSLPDRIRIGTKLATTVRDSQSYASNTTTSSSPYYSGSGIANGVTAGGN